MKRHGHLQRGTHLQGVRRHVNLERIVRIEPYGKESRLAILSDGTRLPVSRTGYARLLEAMGETLQITAVPLSQPAPGGGNVPIRELRSTFDEMSPEQRIEQAALLSNVAGELAASRRAS